MTTPPLERYVDLASSRLGASVLAASDDFFAPKERLIEVAEPVFDAGRYTDHGKWMDGWETRRRRRGDRDWCVIALATAGRIHDIVVDTAHFDGNHPEACAIDGVHAPGIHDIVELETQAWRELLPRVPLGPSAAHRFNVMFMSEILSITRLGLRPMVFPCVAAV